MADCILRTADGLEYQYRELPWGDLIEGDKEVLQRMGIGIGLAFPGELGANKRQISTTDPRGFRCTIENSKWSRFSYTASIEHPGRKYHYPAEDWKEAFPGVLYQEAGYYQRYKGSAEALTVAGIVPADMFPGMPGMRSVCVSILADGSLPTGHKNANIRRDVARRITKCGKHTYEVVERVSRELGEKRCEAWRADRQAWEVRMAAMPRAQRLDKALRYEINEVAKQRRSGLYLAWSRPKFVPKFNALPQGPFAR